MVLPTRPNRNIEIPNGPFGLIPDPVEEKAEESAQRIRARNEDGRFKEDDPSTPEDEAWIEIAPEQSNVIPDA